MYSMLRRNDDIVYGVTEYVCDSQADLDSLPNCKPGSSAIVLEAGNIEVYMKNTEGKWVKL